MLVFLRGSDYFRTQDILCLHGEPGGKFGYVLNLLLGLGLFEFLLKGMNLSLPLLEHDLKVFIFKVDFIEAGLDGVLVFLQLVDLRSGFYELKVKLFLL